MRVTRRPQHKVVSFQNVDETGIKLGDPQDEFEYSSQNIMQRIRCRHPAGDVVQQIHLGGLIDECVATRAHRSKLAASRISVQRKFVVVQFHIFVGVRENERDAKTASLAGLMS